MRMSLEDIFLSLTTEETDTGGVLPAETAEAIAGSEGGSNA